MKLDTITCMDALAFARTLPDNSVHCVVTSPPYYGLRDYGIEGQIGLEDTPQQWLARMVELFREIRRGLREDGTCWVNMGDSYGSAGGDTHSGFNARYFGKEFETDKQGSTPFPSNGHTTGLRPKNLLMMPARLAIALQEDGFYLRSEIVWAKPNPMPESTRDRPTKAHEMVYLLSKSGTSTFWTHRDHDGTRQQPKPDYRWIDGIDSQETDVEPENWRDELLPDGKKRWRRINLWAGHDYWYDQEAIREPVAESSAQRLSQDIEHQTGSTRANGGMKSNGNLKAVGETSGRNKRTVWTIPTEAFSGSHFAVFPQALIEPMILAGCPARVCSVCGAPWVRDVERETDHYNEKEGISQRIRNAGAISGGTEKVTLGMTQFIQRKTLGFRPTCDHDAPTDAGICYDPFMGAGTTGLVAMRLGRHYIGSELNPEYVALARERIAQADPYQPKAVEDGVTQLSLFAQEDD